MNNYLDFMDGANDFILGPKFVVFPHPPLFSFIHHFAVFSAVVFRLLSSPCYAKGYLDEYIVVIVVLAYKSFRTRPSRVSNELRLSSLRLFQFYVEMSETRPVWFGRQIQRVREEDLFSDHEEEAVLIKRLDKLSIRGSTSASRFFTRDKLQVYVRSIAVGCELGEETTSRILGPRPNLPEQEEDAAEEPTAAPSTDANEVEAAEDRQRSTSSPVRPPSSSTPVPMETDDGTTMPKTQQEAQPPTTPKRKRQRRRHREEAPSSRQPQVDARVIIHKREQQRRHQHQQAIIDDPTAAFSTPSTSAPTPSSQETPKVPRWIKKRQQLAAKKAARREEGKAREEALASRPKPTPSPLPPQHPRPDQQQQQQQPPSQQQQQQTAPRTPNRRPKSGKRPATPGSSANTGGREGQSQTPNRQGDAQFRTPKRKPKKVKFAENSAPSSASTAPAPVTTTFTCVDYRIADGQLDPSSVRREIAGSPPPAASSNTAPPKSTKSGKGGRNKSTKKRMTPSAGNSSTHQPPAPQPLMGVGAPPPVRAAPGWLDFAAGNARQAQMPSGYFHQNPAGMGMTGSIAGMTPLPSMLQLVNDNNQRLMASMQQQLAWQKSFEEQMDRHVEIRSKWVEELNRGNREAHQMWPTWWQQRQQQQPPQQQPQQQQQQQQQQQPRETRDSDPPAPPAQMPPLEPRDDTSSSSSSDEFEDSNAEWDEPDPTPPTKDKQD